MNFQEELISLSSNRALRLSGYQDGWLRLAHKRRTTGIFASIFRFSSLNPYTVLIGPGYCDTKESMVSSVTPSTVACATKILSKGSL